MVSLNSSFMFIFVQSRLYQENLKTLFERSSGEGLQKIVMGCWLKYVITKMEFCLSVSNFLGSVNLKVIIVFL